MLSFPAVRKVFFPNRNCEGIHETLIIWFSLLELDAIWKFQMVRYILFIYVYGITIMNKRYLDIGIIHMQTFYGFSCEFFSNRFQSSFHFNNNMNAKLQLECWLFKEFFKFIFILSSLCLEYTKKYLYLL